MKSVFAVLVAAYVAFECSTQQNQCLNKTVGLGRGGAFHIPDVSFTASSSRWGRFPYYARLNGPSAWCTNFVGSWLQLSLGQRYRITAVMTQGSMLDYAWVTRYRVEYRLKGGRWIKYPKVLTGNKVTDYPAGKMSHLNPAIFAHDIRVRPLAAHGVSSVSSMRFNLACLRLELFGCRSNADTSCSFWKDMGFLASGPRLVDPDGSGPIETFCDQETDGGGWAVIQRRIAPFALNFTTPRWNEYVKGFGNVSGEFWFGLENIYRLVKNGAELRIHVRKEGEEKGEPMKYASYGVFSLAGACDNYRWHLESFNGSLTNDIYGHSWQPHNENDMPFTTRDRDNDNCGSCTCGYGWWFNHCGHADLNYRKTPHWEGTDNVYTAMMVREAPFFTC